MIEVRPLTSLELNDLKRIADGYSSDSKYVVVHNDSGNYIGFDLQLVALEQLFIRRYVHFNVETLRSYNEVLKSGHSFGAYDGNLLIGLVIAGAYLWNQSLWVYEFHVAETHRKKGVGKQLMNCAAQTAKRAGLRIIVCETQNTNVTAINVYRKLSFRMEGVDISFYSNADYPDGEIAIFMKRRLT
ncbi:MAG: hypothetical protein NVSMB56_01180 [Pyrinomonadaceae bacterium]